MKKYLLLTGVLAVSFSIIVSSCKKDKKKDDVIPEPTSSFDRGAMLSNYGNNIIFPAYSSLVMKLNDLGASIDNFIQNPDSAGLVSLQTNFKNAYLGWQLCSVFEFGPGEQESMRSNVNVFPTDTTQINSNISAGTYDFNTASNVDAKGFPCLDYLIFGTGSSFSQILYKYTLDPNSTKRKEYLGAVFNETKNRVNRVYSSWSSAGGNYINTFITSLGTDVGSSMGELVNQLNFDFELLKNAKIGIPAGKKTLGIIQPEKVEAYYSKISVQLALENLNAIENVFLGRTSGGADGSGFDDYLNYLQATHPNGALSEVIKNQFTLAKSKLQAVADPLSNTVSTNLPAVDAAYNELQKLVVLLKTDMPSAMGIMITYQDNDGD